MKNWRFSIVFGASQDLKSSVGEETQRRCLADGRITKNGLQPEYLQLEAMYLVGG